MPGFDLLWALVMPIVSIGSALVDLANFELSIGTRMLQLTVRLGCFFLPFCITLAVMAGRNGEWLRLFSETRDAVERARNDALLNKKLKEE